MTVIGLQNIETNIRVYSVDRQGVKFGSGPIEDAKVENIVYELNGAGSASISFHPLARNASEVRLVEREIQIWFDETLVWWGVPWKDGGSLGNVTIECEGLLSLFTKRFVDRTSLLYTSIDQLSIAWALLTYAQDESVQANRDFNINAAAFLPSGKTRSRNYDRASHEEILSLVEEFPTLNDGFDFDIVVDGTGQRLWTPYYPKKGVLHENLGIRVTKESSVGVTGIAASNDASALTTHAYVSGGTSGSVKFEEDYEDLAASAKYGVMQGVISEGSQKDVGWLLERATNVVNSRKVILPVPAMTMQREPRDYFDLVDTGDRLPIYMDYGYYQINGIYRLGKKTWTPENVSFEFITEEVA